MTGAAFGTFEKIWVAGPNNTFVPPPLGEAQHYIQDGWMWSYGKGIFQKSVEVEGVGAATMALEVDGLLKEKMALID